MSITGNLRTMELSELLQWLANGAKTGTLVVANSEVQKRIFFEKGNVIATASSDPKEYLGHFLVGRGYIDEAALAEAMSLQDVNKMLLGKILVTINAISESALDDMLRLKSEETVYEIFTWEEGDFHFLDGELPQFAMVPLTINLSKLILEGVHRIDKWRMLRSAIPSNRVVPVAVGPLEPDPDDPMSERILSLIDDDRSLEDIALHSHSGDYHVWRVAYEQARKGGVKLIRPRSERRSVTEAAGERPVDTDSLLSIGEDLLDDRDYTAAMRHFRAALSLAPNNQKTRHKVESAEKKIHQMLEAEGVVGKAVPNLAQNLEELPRRDISPEEGFVLSRVNGTYDLQTIVKISPMSSLDALLVFRRLVRVGYITLTQ
ncbi:MAG: DUF4388 domain-containing protein [Acidobacteriota bacterium]|nr:DUF4388 domain-containing protein [Acidobacteriota bacterium]